MFPSLRSRDKAPDFGQQSDTAGLIEVAGAVEEIFNDDKIELAAVFEEFAQADKDQAMGRDGEEFIDD